MCHILIVWDYNTLCEEEEECTLQIKIVPTMKLQGGGSRGINLNAGVASDMSEKTSASLTITHHRSH